jgi:hypothetical protein
MSSAQGDAKLFARVSKVHFSSRSCRSSKCSWSKTQSWDTFRSYSLLVCYCHLFSNIMASLFSVHSGTLPKSFLEGAGLEARLPPPPTPRAYRKCLASSADDDSTPNGSLHKTLPQGKVAELRQELNSGGKKDKNNSAKKIALKKIVANMTMSNNDMVALFPDIIACMQIPSLEIKKM